MASLLSTLFSSRGSYLAKHMSKINNSNSFPVHCKIEYDDFLVGTRDKSVLVTGGMDEERSAFLLKYIASCGGKILIFHNGNRFLKAESISRSGISASEWDGNIYVGMNKAQILSLLAGEKDDDDLLPFWVYAFEVCEILGMPVSIDGFRKIDWLEIAWQQELILKGKQKERTFDLLSRFDKQMADRAARGMCRIERLTRNLDVTGKGIDEILHKDIVLTKEVYGSNSIITRQCFEAVKALAESGVQITLILDDVYLPEVALIRDNYRNVRLVLGADDITQLSQDVRLTNRNCNVVVFGNMSYGSARTVSEIYFGEYDKLQNDITSGQSRSSLLSVSKNTSMTVRHERDLRLKPESIVNLPFGCAFVHLINGQEGMLQVC